MTRVLIDTCVLYPSILRNVLLGCAKVRLFEPLWSEHILEEWRRAAGRNGIASEAGIEIALVRANWRNSVISVPEALKNGLILPDEDDRHVLAAAIEGKASELLTLNTRDFPTRLLGKHDVVRRHPDEFLMELALANSNLVKGVIDGVCAVAEKGKGERFNRRKTLQRAGVPRVAKWDAALTN